MATKKQVVPLPPHGFINELSRLTGVSRQTCSKAVRGVTRGEVATKVRRMYRKLYVNPYLEGASTRNPQQTLNF